MLCDIKHEKYSVYSKDKIVIKFDNIEKSNFKCLSSKDQNGQDVLKRNLKLIKLKTGVLDLSMELFSTVIWSQIIKQVL